MVQPLTMTIYEFEDRPPNRFYRLSSKHEEYISKDLRYLIEHIYCSLEHAEPGKIYMIETIEMTNEEFEGLPAFNLKRL